MANLPHRPPRRTSHVERLISEITAAWRPENHLRGKGGKPPRRNDRGELTALCPLHEETTPSFNLDPAKGIFKCHGCGKGGGVLDFARELTGTMGAVEALYALAERWHIPLSANPTSSTVLRGSALGANGTSSTALRRPAGGSARRTFALAHSGKLAGQGGTSRADRPTDPRVQSVGPSEVWDKCSPVDAGSPAHGYLDGRGLASAIPSGEVRVAPGKGAGGRGNMLAVPLRDLERRIRDLQFRTLDPKAPHDQRFKRLGRVPQDVGPVVFGWVDAPESLTMVEGLTDYLAALGPLALAPGNVIGIPGTGSALKTVEALARARKLAGVRTVVLAFDADPSGDRAAEEVAPLLTNEGIEVKRLRPPAPHKDVAAWAAALGSDAPTVFRAAVENAPTERPFPWVVPAPEFVQTSHSTVSFLIPDRVPVGSFVLVQGPPGVGKTWLTLHYAKQVAEQDKRVVLVAQEGPASALAQRMTLMGAVHRNIGIAHRQPIRLDDPEWVEKLAKLCRSQRVALLVLDPLVDLHQGDENESRDASRITSAVKELQRSHADLSVVLLHHTVKGAWSSTGAKREHSRGSGVLPGAADVQLGLTELEAAGTEKPAAHFRLEVVKARDFARPAATDYTLAIRDGRVDVKCEEVTTSAVEREESDAELDQRVLALLPPAGTPPIAAEEIRKRTRVGTNKVRDSINRLVSAGSAERVANQGVRRSTPTPEVSQ